MNRNELLVDNVLAAARCWAHAAFGADLTAIEADGDHYSTEELALVLAVAAYEAPLMRGSREASR